MAATAIVLDRQAVAQNFSFGTTGSGGAGLVTIYKGTSASSTVGLDVKGSALIGGDLTVTGTLHITGSIDETSVTQLKVADLTITTNVGGATPASDTSGLTIEGTTGATVGAIYYNSSSATKFSIGDGSSQADIVGAASTQTLTNKTLTTPVINGISTGTGVAIGATISTLSLRDVNGSLTAVNFLMGYSTTATAAGTTTLTVASNYLQFFTGSTTQILVMPVVSTLVLGQSFEIVNASSGAITINSSGGNAIVILAAGTSVILECIAISGTGASVWAFQYYAAIVASGKSLTVSNTLTFTGTDGSTVNFGTGGTVAYGTLKYHHATTISGTQDSTNKVFTIANAVDTGSEQLIHNGNILTPGGTNDYLISGTTVTLQAAYTAPAATDTLRFYGNY